MVVLALVGSTLVTSPAEADSNGSDRTHSTWPAAGSMLLRPSEQNPRYFEEGRHRTVYLQGAYIGLELQDYIFGSPKTSDWSTAVDVLEKNNANFLRMWTAETTGAVGSTYLTAPMPWQRTTVCCAMDGGDKFDLSRLDVGDLRHPSLNSAHYFERLRARVIDARKHGIYVSVMLFHSFGWENSVRIPGLDIWSWHPFNAANNVNGVNPDTNGDGSGLELGSLGNSWQRYQNAYIRETVKSVGDLDNVLYEVCNECWDTPATNDWQNAVIAKIHSYERRDGFARHPVGMTSLQDYNNDVLAQSRADFVSPGGASLEASPPLADGHKVSVLDMDHILPCSNHNSPTWPMKALTRGNNLWYIYCGPTADGISYGDPSVTEQTVMTRMGIAKKIADRLKIRRFDPVTDSADCSTTYCMKAHGAYLGYLPEGGSISIRLDQPGRYRVIWIDPGTGSTVFGGRVSAGMQNLMSPLESSDAAVYLVRG